MPIFKLMLLFFVWLSVCFSCADSAIAWSGRVVDKVTKEPIEGAVIVRSWDRNWATPAGSVSSLVALGETTTNDNGDFSISKWRGFFRISVPFFAEVRENESVIYKPGYKLVSVEDKPSLIELESIPDNYYLRKEENEYASAAGYYNFDIYETKIYKKIVKDEENKLKLLNRYVDGVIFKGFIDEKIYLSGPIDIGFDTEGYICIIDEIFKRHIKKFDVNGYYVKSIDHNAILGSLSGSIYFDDNNNMYLSSSGKLLKFYKDKNYIGFKEYKEKKFFSQLLDFSSSDGSYFIIRSSNFDDDIYRDKFMIINFDKKTECTYNFNGKNISDVYSDNDKFYTISTVTNKNNYHITDKFINYFDNKCELLKEYKIEIDNIPTCFVVGNNEIIVSDGYNLYFYDKNYNLKYSEKFYTGHGRPENNKNSYLGGIYIKNMKADKDFNYLYIIDSRYDRILKYNIKTRSFAKKGEKIIPKKVEQTKKTYDFVEGVNGIGVSR